ncbi:MAG: transcription initiation factor IIB family protein [Halobacteriales archaeon]|nr:transcription initiation factor IIB family protein [Halobacteriales archaeon]
MSGSDTGQQPSCPECTGRLRPASGETVCEECGLVVAENRLDHGPEWRPFEALERERTGAPLTRSRHDRGLSTEIGRGSRRLTGRKRRQLTRLRRQHNRARISTKADRNRVYAFTEIRRLVADLSLPQSIRDRACVLFESAQDADLLRGRSIEGFAAAAVYAVCRTDTLSRTLGEIVAAAHASENELKAAYNAMNRELGLPTGPVDPVEYLPRFASELELPAAIERIARDYAAIAADRGLVVGRNPCGIAAACLYLAAREAGVELTQQAAADVADVTPVTLRTTYVALRDGDGDGDNDGNDDNDSEADTVDATVPSEADGRDQPTAD